jgi:hypothetical protein
MAFDRRTARLMSDLMYYYEAWPLIFQLSCDVGQAPVILGWRSFRHSTTYRVGFLGGTRRSGRHGESWGKIKSFEEALTATDSRVALVS